MNDWKPLLERLDGLLERLDRIAPAAQREPDRKSARLEICTRLPLAQ
jgi:hypothetical protein